MRACRIARERCSSTQFPLVKFQQFLLHNALLFFGDRILINVKNHFWSFQMQA